MANFRSTTRARSAELYDRVKRVIPPPEWAVFAEDVDAIHKAALAKGAKELRAPEDQFYGDRSATVEDPWGHRWTVMTHVEDVSEEEMGKRMAAMGQQG